MKKIVLLAHCVLNAQCELPEASDFHREKILEALAEKRYSMIQLPCPELCYQALERKSIEPGDDNAGAYAEFCRELLKPLIGNLEEYKKHDIQVAGVVGIDTSPSCSVINKRGIMMRVLLEEAGAREIDLGTTIDMPVSDQVDFEKINSL